MFCKISMIHMTLNARKVNFFQTFMCISLGQEMFLPIFTFENWIIIDDIPCMHGVSHIASGYIVFFKFLCITCHKQQTKEI